ncbi:MAG TPA: DUF1580 domain-containing protein [Pirellulales bacterium]|nr:DUF1580 domain-containing protein [Pirellulales bacterium]
MIDSQHESLVALADVPSLIPIRRGTKRPHVSCIYRWCQRGLRGVKLESIQVGGTCCTSREALQRFFERLTAARDGNAAPGRTVGQRRKTVDRANAELEKAGW